MKGWIKKISIITIVIAVGTFAYIRKKGGEEIPFYSVEKPERRELTYYVNASGMLQPEDKITVGSLVAGRVIKLHVDDNDIVKKDQLLVTLDDGVGDAPIKKLTALLQELEAVYAYQKSFYQRQKALFKSGQLSRDAFEQEERDYRVAQARIEQVRAEKQVEEQRYNNLFIRSPEEGIVTARRVDLGQMVTSQLQATELFSIAKDLTKMEANIDVDEADIGMIKVGQEVTFTVDAFRRKHFHATVKQIKYNAKIVENVVTYVVVISVANNDLMLRPGMTTNVSIKASYESEALSVPNRCLRVSGVVLEKLAGEKGFQVQALSEKEKKEAGDTLWIKQGTLFKQVPVKTGITDRRFTQILEGLDEQADVVLEVMEPTKENLILKQHFGQRGIGAK